jgi:ferredoxin
MLDAFRSATRDIDPTRVHLEYFRAPEVPAEQPLRAFTVELARSGVSVEVPGGCSILDALMMNGIDAPYSCYEGLCGTSETKVLRGEPEHRDHILTDKARAEGSIIICCSGSRTEKLVLDL